MSSDAASLRTLTGVRSGKKSYYVELRRTEERMTSAVRALEAISSDMVRTRDDPRGLLVAVVRAAAGHLHADWTMITVRSGSFPGLDTRFLAVDRTGRLVESDLGLPASLRRQLTPLRADPETLAPDEPDAWVRVPMTLDGEVLGRLVARLSPGAAADHEDLWVLRILANQAAMALHTATLHSTAVDLRARAQQLYDEVARNTHDLQTRTAQLERAEDRLTVASQRELLDAERHRIALELHDSVAQYVLSAGLAVEVCRSEALEREGGASPAVDRLAQARDLVAQAGDQVRSVIYALHHDPAGDEPASLPDLLHGLAAQHGPALSVTVRTEGVPLASGAQTDHALARIAGEALFNVSIHAHATRAMVRLRYTPQGIVLSISDDGGGDPRELRRRLRLSARTPSDGRHQGLANMARRAGDLGGTFAIRRARLGGVRIDVTVPATDAG